MFPSLTMPRDKLRKVKIRGKHGFASLRERYCGNDMGGKHGNRIRKIFCKGKYAGTKVNLGEDEGAAPGVVLNDQFVTKKRGHKRKPAEYGGVWRTRSMKRGIRLKNLAKARAAKG